MSQFEWPEDDEPAPPPPAPVDVEAAPPPPPVEPNIDPSDPESEAYNPRELEDEIPRSSGYSAAFANRILDRIEEGMTFDAIHKTCNGGPEPRVVYNWAKQCDTFNNALVDSIAIRAEVLMDQIVGIADSGGPAAAIKQRIDTRKELAAFDNKRFIKRTARELTGANGGPLEINDAALRKPIDAVSKEEYLAMNKVFFMGPQGVDAGMSLDNINVWIPHSIGGLSTKQLAEAFMFLPREKLQAALNQYGDLAKARTKARAQA